MFSFKRLSRSFGTLAIAAAILTVSLTAFVPAAQAHERRQVGDYTFVVGFSGEPAYVEEANGASLRVTRADGTPVEGLQQSLKVEVTNGGESRVFDLASVFNQPGSYVARFIPTKSGSYAFRFFGTIEGQEINERFESGPGRFDEVKATDDLQFPVKVPTNAQLASELQQPTAGNEVAAATDAQSVQDAIDRADRAQTIGLVVGGLGIIVGLIGVVLAVRANSRGRPSGGQPAGGAEPV
jgi:hypothetical protein